MLKNIVNHLLFPFVDLLQKANENHEIAKASLSKQLSDNEVIIKESVDAADTLMDDIQSIQRQLKSLPVSINWTKFKVILVSRSMNTSFNNS